MTMTVIKMETSLEITDIKKMIKEYYKVMTKKTFPLFLKKIIHT